jgi:hypothetical protein
MDLTMMERVGDRQEKMEGYCSTGQSPQRAVVPVEEDMKQKHQIYTNYKNIIKYIFSIVYVNLVCRFHTFPRIKSPSVWRYISVTCRRVYTRMYG